MSIVRSLLRTCGVGLAFAALAGEGAIAEPWPSRPVTMIVPFGAGSGIDVLGRVLAAALAERLGQSVIVENVGGAGGMTGTARAAKASPSSTREGTKRCRASSSSARRAASDQ